MKHLGWILCLKYLQRRLIVLLSVAAVALSCALLIVTDSLFTGFIDAVENSVGRYLGDVLIQAPSGLRISDYEVLIAQLEETEAVQAAAAVLNGQGLLLSGPGRVRPVKVCGIELPQQLEVSPLDSALVFQNGKPAKQIDFGNWPDGQVGGLVGIGVLSRPDEKTDRYDMQQIREFLGKPAVLTTGTAQPQANDSTGSGDRPQIRRQVIRFTIADVVMTGVSDLDESFVYLPLETLSQVLYPNAPVSADVIQIRLAGGVDEEVAMAVISGVWNRFAQERFAWYSRADIQSTRQMQAQLIAEYHKQLRVLLFIFGLVSLGIILLVLCIFYLIVMTRRKDIAILKSCGLGSGSVAMIFVVFGMVAGTLGAALGIGLGCVFTRHINAIEQTISTVFGLKLWQASTYMFSRIPNTVNWASVWWIAAAGIAAAALGALIPAITAARVKPVEILRYE
ncbi:MAG: ABC transporter permease [Planctomycetes bacterium]|jgi:lipoprotein-releasing system permease protein|nr:ABC transporter permease [Planctomycetota bacterium]